MSYALIFWTKSRTRSVVATAVIPTYCKEALNIGDTVTVPFGNKTYKGKIVQLSEDPEWLDTLEISKCGKILEVEKSENKKEIAPSQGTKNIENNLLSDRNASDNSSGPMHDSFDDPISKGSAPGQLLTKDSILENPLEMITLITKRVFEEMTISKESSSTKLNDASKNTAEDIEQVELQPGSKIYVAADKLYKIRDKHSKSPNEMVRQLLLLLIGKEALPNMTALGKKTSSRKTASSNIRQPVPPAILAGVKAFVDAHGAYKLERENYHEIINKFCSRLRNQPETAIASENNTQE